MAEDLAAIRARVEQERQKIGDQKSFSSLLLEGGYTHMGGRKKQSEAASLYDRHHVANFAENAKNTIGEKWVYVTYHDSKGEAILTPFYSPGIGMVYPDELGRVRKLNKDYLKTQVEIHKHIENKVTEMMRLCVVSDEMACDVLDLDENTYKSYLEATKKYPGMSDKMAEIDGTVTAIKSLPADSVSQVQALSKLRYLCKQLRHRFASEDFHRDLADAKKVTSDAPNNDDLLVKANPNLPPK